MTKSIIGRILVAAPAIDKMCSPILPKDMVRSFSLQSYHTPILTWYKLHKRSISDKLNKSVILFLEGTSPQRKIFDTERLR